MATYHKGYKDIKVRLIDSAGDTLARKVYEFGRLSHDYNDMLPDEYKKSDPMCKMLIDKIIEGTTLPKFALEGTRLNFEISGISRICLAQLTRDKAIFASQGGGVYPLTQDFNIPLSICKHNDIMNIVKAAQDLLEEAYIMCAEREVPALEARYIGLHAQTISLTASYIPTDFVRSCYSRTSSNFCDECNYIYRKMYNEIRNMISRLRDKNSIALWNWLFPEAKCINDGIYTRERLYNSDFTTMGAAINNKVAINDWRKSGWKDELERIAKDEPYLLTNRELHLVETWVNSQQEGQILPTSYSSDSSDALCNAIKYTNYYREHRDEE